MSILLTLFGYPKITRDDREVELDTRKAVALLAYLSLSGEAVSRDALAALLWPDYDQSSARATLRRTLSVLNKAVGEGVLEIEREWVRVAPDAALRVDVLEFEQLRAGSLEDLGQAASLIRDRFMSGFSLRDSSEFDDWQFFHAERLSREYSVVLEKLVESYAARSEWEAAIQCARQWLALDNLHEEAHRQLMLLYARSGQRSAALRQYRECVRILDQELGVAPLVETTALYEAILENRLPAPEEPLNASVLQHSPAAETAKAAHQPAFPLVGRDFELNTLLAVYDRAATGHFCVLEGEAGIGKTRLAEELLNEVEKRGALTVRMRCYEGESSLAYAPFVSALSALLPRLPQPEVQKAVPPLAFAEASRLLPEMSVRFPNLTAPPPLDGPGAQGRFFKSLHQIFSTVLGGQQPGVLFLDDAQWADAASLDLLAYFLRRLSGSRVLVLITWRTGVPQGNPALSSMIQEAQRRGLATRIVLQRLEPADVALLAQAFRLDLPDNFTQRLYVETEGLPFFAVEYLGQAAKGEQDWQIPASVQGLLLQRLNSVDETSRQLLSTAAVIGRSFDLDTLREASGRSDLETVTGLETLLSAGLVEERPQNAVKTGEVLYDFTHEKLRSLAYDETSQARRRLLHRRVAEVLTKHGETYRERGAQAAVTAYHFQASGDLASAASYYSQAGDHARALYANMDAVSHYESALACGYPDPAVLHEAIGDLRTLIGEYSSAISSYEKSAAAAQESCQSRLERKLGDVHARLGEWELAESHYQRAVESAEESCAQSELAGIYAGWSLAASQQNRIDQARSLAQKALDLAEFSGDRLSQAEAHNGMGILARRQGGYEEALHHLQESLKIAQEMADPRVKIASLNNLALVYFDMGRFQEGIDRAEQALKLCMQTGDRHREAALLNNLADLSHAAGAGEQAMAYLTRAVAIFSEIGVDSGSMKPEVWKLTEW